MDGYLIRYNRRYYLQLRRRQAASASIFLKVDRLEEFPISIQYNRAYLRAVIVLEVDRIQGQNMNQGKTMIRMYF